MSENFVAATSLVDVRRHGRIATCSAEGLRLLGCNSGDGHRRKKWTFATFLVVNGMMDQGTRDKEGVGIYGPRQPRWMRVQ
jgi:hypothetical protein